MGRKRYIKGFFTGANARLVYRVPTEPTVFKAEVGLFDVGNSERRILRDWGGAHGKAVMQVLLDGKEAYNSGVLDASTPPREVVTPLNGAKTIELLVTPVDGPGEYCWAVWGDARFESC
jgi:hypothetical protein